MSSKIYVGIDPGKKGAIFKYFPSTLRMFMFHPMPETDEDLREILNFIARDKEDFSVWCERIPKYAGKAQSGSSVATLFSSYRYIVGYLEGRGVTVNLVVPQVWMKPYRLECPDWPTLTYSKRKKFLHEQSQKFFSDGWTRIPRQVADAALIALHGYNQNQK